MRLDEANGLWESVRRGDMHAFEKIYKAYYDMLANYAGNYIDNRFKIDEAVQNLFLFILERRDRLVISKNFPAYLCVLLRRQIRDQKLQDEKYLLLESNDDASCYLSDNYNPENDMLTREEYVGKIKNVNRTLNDRLSCRQREILYLKYYKNLTNKQIADKLGVGDGTVRNISFRAISSLRKHLSYVYKKSY